MLKKISAQDLVVGMYLHRFEGAWLDHPFWRKAFLVEQPQDVAAVRASGVTELWIDTDRGLDRPAIAAPAAAPVPGGSLPPMAPVPLAPSRSARALSPPASAAAATSDFQQEVARARHICQSGSQAVASLFREARMGRAVSTADALPLVEEISASVMRNPGALISIARLKSADDYTYMHSVATCALMVALARQLGLDGAQVREAGLGGLMHDLGKALMPPDVLNKPGKLTDAEFGVMRSHPREGWRMLHGGGTAPASTMDIALHHHEKVDGSGYPDGLRGDAISLLARMGAVCDVYDAITSNRPYKSGWDPAFSIRAMNGWTGHFDPVVLQAFIRSIGIYPCGSLVRLVSGKLAVVTEQNAQQLLCPTIRIFFSTKSNEPIARQLIDLAAPGCSERIAQVEDAAKWGFRDLDALWVS